jgi:hypothetical protein
MVWKFVAFFISRGNAQKVGHSQNKHPLGEPEGHLELHLIRQGIAYFNNTLTPGASSPYT